MRQSLSLVVSDFVIGLVFGVLARQAGLSLMQAWNPESGERTDLAVGELAGDIEPLDWSLDGRRILLRQISRATQQLYTYDLETATLTRLQHQGGTYASAQFGLQGQIIALWSDATHLPQVVALDGATGVWKGTILAAGEAPPARSFTSVSFRSSDGAEVQDWLGLPSGTGPFPTILSVHGGPHFAMSEVYDPEARHGLTMATPT